MKLITIQHKSVLDEINEKGLYRADIRNVAGPNLVKAYERMMEIYGYNTCPIFLAIENRYAEMFGAKTDSDCIALELDIPDKHIKIQDYYDWTDAVFFMEAEGNDYDNEQLRFILNRTSPLELTFKKEIIPKRPLQATVPELRKEWLIDTLPCPTKLIESHVGTGGRNILQPLYYYKRSDNNVQSE